MRNDRDNIIVNLSFKFALNIVVFCETLEEQKKYTIARQLIKSGTSIGANIREAQNAESKNDFTHKMAIAQKEINETIYWIELLKETNYLTQVEFDNMNNDAVEVIKLITSIIKSTKVNQINK